MAATWKCEQCDEQMASLCYDCAKDICASLDWAKITLAQLQSLYELSITGVVDGDRKKVDISGRLE